MPLQNWRTDAQKNRRIRSVALRKSRTDSLVLSGAGMATESDSDDSSVDTDIDSSGRPAIPRRVLSASSEMLSRNNSFNSTSKRPSMQELFSLDAQSVPPSPNATPAPDTNSLKVPPEDHLDLSATDDRHVVFKKFISKRKLIPKAKSFRRVVTDLENEVSPLDTEIQHELIITSALKDESRILSSKIATATLTQPSSLNMDNLKKFELINKANEAWNKKPLHRTRSRSSSVTSTASDTASRLKRRQDDTPPPSSKRRILPMSPFLPPSRRNSKLIHTTSVDLESMKLDEV
ncbi:hypothetical protein OGAPHI_001397 [Ogataea philodendri]|uniref:Uncharacterized protein n=1 Tax=Ogataea philodendri TaxID=1378263 RepID=A0A9P8T8S0_9ASCO|nr:uncharacterized protein OGAPHI_001397 [Ogataea philodendri]KAH3669276.1 hypothetical protein OGAPHI_001397 [Ogataea philodendri]